MGKNTTTIIIAIAFMLIGGGVAMIGYTEYQEAQKIIENSVEVQGEIISSTINEEREKRNSDTGSRYKTVYDPQVEYKYNYQGESYTNNNIKTGSINNDYSSREKAEEEISEYKKGSSVTVKVNSENPNESYLEKSKASSYMVFIGMGILFLIVGLGLFTNRFLRN